MNVCMNIYIHTYIHTIHTYIRRRNSCSGLQLFPLLARICCSAILFPLVASRVCFIAQFNHRGCSACFFTSCCLFSTVLLTLFDGLADVLLNMIVLYDGQARSQSSAGTPSRAVASASGVKRNACVCVAALSVRLLFCPVGSATVFFVGATVAVLSCNSARGWLYSRVLRLRNC
jgi:hypothetical protein